MANTTCRQELNRQLQVLQSRVKQLEDNVDGLNESVVTNIAQTAAGFAALIEEGIVTGLPTYIANQLILRIAAAALDMAEEDLENFPGVGEAGELQAALSDAEDMLAKILKILCTPAFAELWKKLSFALMVPQLALPPYGAAFLNAALASAEQAVEAAAAALAADPLNAQLQAALSAAQDLRDSQADAADAMNRITSCKITSSVLGL